MSLTEDQLIEARHKLAAGRVVAYRAMPYYTRALMAVETFEREGMGTFGVDKHWRLYYDPAKCLEWSTKEIAAVWLHEIQHLIRGHNQRFEALEGKGHNQKQFNAAADAAINSDLKAQGFTLPNPDIRVYVESKLSPKWKKGMTAEQMYWSIWAGNGSGEQQPEEGESPQSGSNQSDEEQPSEDSEASEDGSQGDQEDNTAGGDSEELNEDDGDSENATSVSGNKAEKEESEVSDESATSDSSADDQKKSDGDSDENSDNAETGEGDEATDGEDTTDGSDDGSDASGDDSGDEQGPDEDTDIDAAGDSSDSETGESTDASDEDSQGGDASQPESDCGSCAGGENRDYEEKSSEKAIDSATAEWLKRKTAEDIVDYASSNPGSVPGDTVRDAKTILEPQVDWREEFGAFTRRILAQSSGYQDYTYMRPSRRGNIGSNVIMPSMRAQQPPQIAAILDTSGSMDENKEIAAALGELEALLNRFGRVSANGGMHIINCDAGVASVEMVSELKRFQVVGGGGTDMRVGIKKAAEIKPRVDIIITVTDGGTPWPKERPQENPTAHYAVLLLSQNAQTNSRTRNNIPDWMHVIEVNISDSRRRR